MRWGGGSFLLGFYFLLLVFSDSAIISVWQDRKEKEQRKKENWHIKVCRKIALEQDFPHDLIVKIYLHNDNRVGEHTQTSLYFVLCNVYKVWVGILPNAH